MHPSILIGRAVVFQTLIDRQIQGTVSYSSNGQAFDGINYINPANDLFVNKVRIEAGSHLLKYFY